MEIVKESILLILYQVVDYIDFLVSEISELYQHSLGRGK